MKPKNILVTEFYIDIVKKSIERIGISTDYYQKGIKLGRDDIIFSTNLIDGIKAIIKHPNNKKIYWMQGIEPEESYMRRHSKLRLLILNTFEKIILNKYHALITVSPEMVKYISNKYNLEISNKTFSMPCFNTKIKPECFSYTEKYYNQTYAYVGSLAKWQCFEETVKLYSNIERANKNSKLYVFTPQKEQAVIYLKNAEIEHYEVDFVNSDELHKVLAKIKYGFCLREDNPINEVATPTKFSTYLASGVIPIFTRYIKDFYRVSRNMKYCIDLIDINDAESILRFLELQIDKEDVFEEYSKIFDRYYNSDAYIEKISIWLSRIL